MILAFLAGSVVGAAVFALVLRVNSKIAKYFYKLADKAEEIIEEKTGKDI
ncbi:hypothetical protein PANI_CDS0064 [Maribacter phage Panino]